MLLTERTIEAARSASITDVVAKFVKLKRSGSNHTGLCPFHDEKSGSFHVSEAKGIFKCFGCGQSGDVIAFVMKHEKMDFIAAVEHICNLTGIPLEYEEVADVEKYQKQKTEKELLKQIMRFTVEEYKKLLWSLPEDHPVMEYLAKRGYNREVIAKWNIGWASDDWAFIAPRIIANNWYDGATTLGIIKRTADNERNYDMFHGRLIFPISNKHGEFIGMGGRILPWVDAKSAPKYINSSESTLYSKSKELYGLNFAIRAIQKEGFAFLVEGYTAVITMQEAGDENTVASCGTSLTTEQAKMLRKYTDHVKVMRDADGAGQMAADRDLLILLKEGFKVDIVTLPVKMDPDDFLQHVKHGRYKVEDVVSQDGIEWKVEKLLKDVGDDAFKIGEAQGRVIELLLQVPNQLMRIQYFDKICKRYKWSRAKLQKRLTELEEEKKDVDDDDDGVTFLDKMPKWMDREEFNLNGYCRVNNKKRTGYYSFGPSGHIELTNFLISPIFHIYAARESEYLIEVDNGRHKAVLEIEAKAMINIDLLQQYLVCEGPFLIYGNKAQMLRIATNLLHNFPRCEKISFLGWQQSGFFAFVDTVFVPGEGLKPLNEWGIFRQGNDNYLIPPASAAYKHLQAKGSDPYEADRVLTYRPAQTTVNDWASMMYRVFGDKGIVAIAYAVLTLFRDIIFLVDNNCPHLYGFGERSSGKSKWAESIGALFFKKRSAFNLNSGTDFAFFRYMQAFVNCPALLNEFDEKVLRPEWFQAIKGAFDGEGRQKGVMGSKNKVEVMKIQSTLVLTGQFICTMDDNSIVSRSIIESFSEREFSDEDKQQLNQLKKMEDNGLSNVVTDLLHQRFAFKEKYKDVFNDKLSEWRKDPNVSEVINQRILQNWCHLFCCWKMISHLYTLPVTDDMFEKYCKDNANRWSQFIRSSDTLSEFWNTFAFLVDQGTIHEGFDYKIEQKTSIRIRNNREEEFLQSFPEPTTVIYIRMNNVHKHYQAAYRSRTGKEGMSMENLLHYFSSRKYYVGASKQSRFKRFVRKTENKHIPGFGGSPGRDQPVTDLVQEEVVASSYVFLFDALGLDIKRVEYDSEELSGDVPIPGGWRPVPEEK